MFTENQISLVLIGRSHSVEDKVTPGSHIEKPKEEKYMNKIICGFIFKPHQPGGVGLMVMAWITLTKQLIQMERPPPPNNPVYEDECLAFEVIQIIQ